MVGLVEVALWKRKRVQKGTPEDWVILTWLKEHYLITAEARFWEHEGLFCLREYVFEIIHSNILKCNA